MGEDEPPVILGYGPDGSYVSAYSPPGYVADDDSDQPLEGEPFLCMDLEAGPFWDSGGLLDLPYERLHALLGISRTLHDDAVAWGYDESVGTPGAAARRLSLTRRLRAEVSPGIAVSQTGRQGARPELLHVAYASHWADAQHTGTYPWSTHGMTYAEVGFVHCAEPDQVAGVLERFYDDVTEPLVLLRLDLALIESDGVEVRWETVPGGDAFPHVFAPLDPAWILEARPLPGRSG